MMMTVRAGERLRYYLDATGEPDEDYYTGAARDGEPAGRWTGRGAAAVGLSGEVDRDADAGPLRAADRPARRPVRRARPRGARRRGSAARGGGTRPPTRRTQRLLAAEPHAAR